MFVPTFGGCLAKIDRANAHRLALQTYIDDTFRDETNRPVFDAELDDNSGYHIFRVKTAPNFSFFLTESGLILGDIVQNLRSALDHLCFQLALFHTNGMLVDEQAVQFPIADTIDRFARTSGRYLKDVRPDHIALIDTFQPYHGINGRPDVWNGPYVHQLAMLRDLSNTDKHRVLNPVLLTSNHLAFLGSVRFVKTTSMKPFVGVLVDDIVFNPQFPVEVGREIIRGRMSPDTPARIRVAGYITPQVALTELRPIIPTVERLEKFVRFIVETFQARPELS